MSSVSLYQNGQPLNVNQRLGDLSVSRASPDIFYLYELFLKCFGEKVYDISVERFRKDLFLMCFNLTCNPSIEGEKMVTKDIKERVLAPIDAGVVDVEIVLRNKLPKNTLIYFLSINDIVVSLDQNGLPLDA